MPLYYFHIRNGSALERDPEGMKLPDLESAHAEALVVSRELAGAILSSTRTPSIDCLTRLVVPFCWFRFPSSKADPLNRPEGCRPDTWVLRRWEGPRPIALGHPHDPSGPFLPHGWPRGGEASSGRNRTVGRHGCHLNAACS